MATIKNDFLLAVVLDCLILQINTIYVHFQYIQLYMAFFISYPISALSQDINLRTNGYDMKNDML